MMLSKRPRMRGAGVASSEHGFGPPFVDIYEWLDGLRKHCYTRVRFDAPGTYFRSFGVVARRDGLRGKVPAIESVARVRVVVT
jgi:hypothetical protein